MRVPGTFTVGSSTIKLTVPITQTPDLRGGGVGCKGGRGSSISRKSF